VGPSRVAMQVATGAVLVAGVLAGTGSAAAARPTVVAPDGAYISATQRVDSRELNLTVHSPAMGKAMTVSVLLPQDRSIPRGTLYLLDGAESTGALADWVTKGDASAIFANRDMNVVMPAGGRSEFFTDWQHPDPVVGKPMWETFLTQELPPLVDRTFDTNRHNAVAGVSEGAQSALALVARHPALYTGVASLSGCPAVTGPSGNAYVTATVATTGALATNMWGPYGSPDWAAHDPTLMVDRFRGKNVFLYAGSGRPGPTDPALPRTPGQTQQETNAAGGGLETAARTCTQQFGGQLRQAGIAATEYYPATGLHAWLYWETVMPHALAVLQRGL